MGVGGADFGALVEDLQKTLDKIKLPKREQSKRFAAPTF
jgi:hypothetical protein